MPLTMREFKVGFSFSFVEAARRETRGGEGVEILTNTPFENIRLFNGAFTSGQYTIHAKFTIFDRNDFQ